MHRFFIQKEHPFASTRCMNWWAEMWIHSLSTRAVLLHFMDKIHWIKQSIPETTFSHLNDIMCPKRGPELLIKFLTWFPAFIRSLYRLCAMVADFPPPGQATALPPCRCYRADGISLLLFPPGYFSLCFRQNWYFLGSVLNFYSHVMEYRISDNELARGIQISFSYYCKRTLMKYLYPPV